MKRRSTPRGRRTIPYRRIAFAAPAILAGAIQSPSPAPANEADPLTITVTKPSREVIFSNKEATHYATDTHGRDRRSYAGLYTAMHESLNDYVITLDGRVLEPADAVSVEVLPWSMTRNHAGGVREEVALLDRVPVLTVRIHAGDTAPKEWTLAPSVDHRWIWETPFAQFEGETVGDAFCVRRAGWAPPENVPAWLAVQSSAPAVWSATGVRRSATHPRDAARNAMAKTNPYEPGLFTGAWPAGAKYVDIVFALGYDAGGAAALAARSLAERDAALDARRARIRATIAKDALAIPDARLAKAYDWARASMDVLVMNVRGPGIYAGFHWFPNYWGRDTFICVPGALLVTGQWDEARAILRSFLQFQLLDRGSPRMGRLPNIVNPGDLQYAGVDGTWWYVRAACKYVKARRDAGDPDLEYERELRPALAFMIKGAETMAVDEHGLLTHGDGETWMDAGGEANPFSPRGNRAIEVQALYYNGLRAAQQLANWHDDPAAAKEFGALASRTASAIDRLFWNDDMQSWVDHLNEDGSQDMQVRPNTILALTAVERDWPPLVDGKRARAIVDLAYGKTALPQGVTSLDPADPFFHEKHLDLDRYYYDEAYHNGDVWLWLSGPMISALARTGRVDEARAMLDPLVDDLLDHGAVGAIREIRDGVLTDEAEEFGGATFQAWSMAEMIRAMHEDLAPALGWAKR